MERVRWLRAEWPLSMRMLGGKMKSQLFTPESTDGFIIERIRDNFIEAHFIEKLIYQEKIIDPFGKQEVLDRVLYRNIDFTLYSNYPNIELRNSHRSTKEFVSKLLELCDFSLSIANTSVDLLAWIESIQLVIKQNILVDSLQISGLELEEGVSAKILIKGQKDVRDAMQHLCAKQRFALEKVQAKVIFGNHIVPMQLTNTGNAKIPAEYFNHLLPILRSTIPSP